METTFESLSLPSPHLGSGVMWTMVSLLVGLAHTTQGPVQKEVSFLLMPSFVLGVKSQTRVPA